MPLLYVAVGLEREDDDRRIIQLYVALRHDLHRCKGVCNTGQGHQQQTFWITSWTWILHKIRPPQGLAAKGCASSRGKKGVDKRLRFSSQHIRGTRERWSVSVHLILVFVSQIRFSVHMDDYTLRPNFSILPSSWISYKRLILASVMDERPSSIGPLMGMRQWRLCLGFNIPGGLHPDVVSMHNMLLRFCVIIPVFFAISESSAPRVSISATSDGDVRVANLLTHILHLRIFIRARCQFSMTHTCCTALVGGIFAPVSTPSVSGLFSTAVGISTICSTTGSIASRVAGTVACAKEDFEARKAGNDHCYAGLDRGPQRHLAFVRTWTGIGWGRRPAIVFETCLETLRTDRPEFGGDLRQVISGWRPVVFVTMMRMTEKTTMITPRPSTPQRPSFWESDIFRPKTSHIGIAITKKR